MRDPLISTLVDCPFTFPGPSHQMTVEFSEVMRSREEPDERRFVPELTAVQILQEDIASLVYHEEGPLSGYSLAGPKTDPKDATGGDCDCPSIKNYPRDIRPRRDRRKQVRQPLPLGEMFFGS